MLKMMMCCESSRSAVVSCHFATFRYMDSMCFGGFVFLWDLDFGFGGLLRS